MNPWISGIIGVLVGMLLGFIILGLLVGPRMAEMEATIKNYRQDIKELMEVEP